MPPRAAGAPAPMTEEQTAQLLLQMAQSSQRLTGAVATLATSKASFMRSAADADANIGLSKSQPFVHHEIFAAQRIGNTVTDQHRSGLAPASRDTRPLAPADYDPANAADIRHGTFGAGHDDATPERAHGKIILATTAYHGSQPGGGITPMSPTVFLRRGVEI